MIASYRDTARRRQFAPFIGASMIFALFAYLYAFGFHTAYFKLLQAFGFNFWQWPFLDTDTVLSALRCLRQGVDVFETNPCDPLGRIFDYSPLWLLGGYFPVTEAWITPTGFAFCLLFLFSLVMLPVGRDLAATTKIMFAVISAASAFALERGNNDLVLFALIVLGTHTLSTRSKFRASGYVFFTLAGLLKYYPFAAMGVLLLEPTRMRIAVIGLTCIVIAIFWLSAGSDLIRALRLIPEGNFLEMFGYRSLAYGLASILGLTKSTAIIMVASQIAICVTVALYFGNNLDIRNDLRRLSEHEYRTLTVACITIIGIFFSADNINYRAIFLILAVPPLTALQAIAPNRKLYFTLYVLILCLLWHETWKFIVHVLFAEYEELLAGHIVIFFIHNVIWWIAITEIAVLFINTTLDAKSNLALNQASMN